ncbi:hypothetical protein HUE98_06310 [Candidatus Contubernalis alkalaceticus]|nr:hypothetical protein HUE98_06310 [Candidatus Contubernalis alkalaceticus]
MVNLMEGTLGEDTVTLEYEGDFTGAILDGERFTLNADIPEALSAWGTMTFTGVPLEGATLTLGEEVVGFWNSAGGQYADADEAMETLGANHLIDVSALETAEEAADAFTGLNLAGFASMTANGAEITITAEAGFAGSSIVTEADGSAVTGFDCGLQIGASHAQGFTIKIGDMRSQALTITGAAGETILSQDGTAAASYTESNVVSDGVSEIVSEAALDISTYEKASAAITIFNDAINLVSAERSKLGAFQNRLEHTISNLGASSENLSAAESRIRDIDMAAEMMEFTKNNILNQAATAMLAQANAAPQTVLQLLG